MFRETVSEWPDIGNNVTAWFCYFRTLFLAHCIRYSCWSKRGKEHLPACVWHVFTETFTNWTFCKPLMESRKLCLVTQWLLCYEVCHNTWVMCCMLQYSTPSFLSHKYIAWLSALLWQNIVSIWLSKNDRQHSSKYVCFSVGLGFFS